MSAVLLTTLTATRPATITKTFWLEDGQLARQTSASVYAGQVEQVSVDCLETFATLLVSLGANQCLVYGLAPAPSLELVTQDKWAQAGRPAHQVPRTNAAFRWPDGPGVLVLDYDPRPDHPPLGRDALVAAVRAAAPALSQVAMLWRPSTSSCIFNGDTGEEHRALCGQRLYLLVSDAADIPRAGKALCERLWAQGHGHFAISKAGMALEKALFDTSVWQPSHIDFVAGARCIPPLEQRRGPPVLIPGEQQVVDSREAIPDLSPDLLVQAAAHKAEAKLEQQPEAEQVRLAYVTQRVQELTQQLVQERGMADDQAAVRAQFVVERSLKQQELFAEWPVIVKHPHTGTATRVSVSELLDEPYRWHGCITKDPLEPDYDGGRWVGKLFLISARPMLHSMAHGGQRFKLMRQPERIEIVRGQLAGTVNALLEILRRAPAIFDYGTEMVTPTGRSELLRLEKDNLRYEAASLTQFWRWHRLPDGSYSEVLENPPVDVCAAVLALRGKRGLKPLDAIISAPLLRADGLPIPEAGYDSATRLLLAVEETLPVVPLHPSQGELEAAYDLLLKPFEGFPFVSATDRAVLLAALLTAVQRPILPTAPAFAFDAPRQGTGKTLMAECVAIIATGLRPTAWPHVERNEEETRKRLLTALRSSARVMLWDNIVGTFDSAALAVLLTSETYTDRVLGASQSESFPNRMLVLLTGNNFTASGELPRRVLTCRLDAKTERPFTRAFDTDPVALCLVQRQSLVAAALTLLRGYWVAGRPVLSPTALGSFAAWDAAIRQPVLWIGQQVAPGAALGDPVDAILQRAEMDPADEAHGALMQAWREIFGNCNITARDLLEQHAHGRMEGFGATSAQVRLAHALEEFCPGREMSARSIGRFLMYRRDRPVGGLRIVRHNAPTRDKVLLWRVERADEAA